MKPLILVAYIKSLFSIPPQWPSLMLPLGKVKGTTLVCLRKHFRRVEKASDYGYWKFEK